MSKSKQYSELSEEKKEILRSNSRKYYHGKGKQKRVENPNYYKEVYAKKEIKSEKILLKKLKQSILQVLWICYSNA